MKDDAKIDDVIKGFTKNLSVDSEQRLKGMITLACNYTSAQDVLKAVSELTNTNGVEWVEPDMICRIKTHELNPLFSLQFYLQNSNSNQYDINVVPAWSITTGSEDITVAVIDAGVDPDHEDLSGSVLQGYTCGDSIGYGQPKNPNEFNYKAHGINCAGIIGARNNNKGILGVAHGVKILPVNIAPNVPDGYYEYGTKIITYEGFSGVSDVTLALQWAAARADILSLSWGLDNEVNAFKIAINAAMTNGRNGKGCVVIAASGNHYPTETTIDFPARMNGVIAVGAIDRYGNIQQYSQRGEGLDLVAPSDNIVTTDRMGSLGVNPEETYGYDLTNTNYTQLFSGTSAACPQVAGVAALLLSVNPNLTVNQVRSILRNTATDLGANGYDTTFGYGLVNAYAAVSTFASQITGPTIPGLLTNYSVLNFPPGWSVVWSMQGKTTLPSYCTPNYPAAHQLQIDNSSKLHIQETLVAKVYNANGTLVKTLTKSINTADGFTGTYSQTIPLPNQSISGPLFDGCLLDVQQGYNVLLTSTDFNGATVTYDSFDSPTISTSGNTITFRFRNSTDFSFCQLHIVKGDKVIEFSLRAEAAIHLDPDPPIIAGISGGDNSINITLSENVDSGQPMRGNTFDSWELTIYSYTTGKVVHRQKVSGRSVSIDTSTWEPDTYIVRIWIDDKELVKKFVLE